MFPGGYDDFPFHFQAPAVRFLGSMLPVNQGNKMLRSPTVCYKEF